MNAQDSSDLRPRTVPLPSGHVVGFWDLGPVDGIPLLFFHGTPASRVNWRFLQADDALYARGVRVLAIDRPGIGATPLRPWQPHRDGAQDVVRLLDALGIEQASILAHSGGGPHALACAVELPDRLYAVGLAAGSPPRFDTALGEGTNPDSLRFLKMCAERPRQARAMLRVMGSMVRLAPGRMVEQAVRSLPPADRAVMDDPAMRRAFIEMLLTTLTQGPKGAQQDGAGMYGPWELPLESIKVPVYLWYGDEDRNVSPAVGTYFGDRIPGSRLEIVPGEGHLSILQRLAGRFLEALVPAQPAHHVKT